MGNILSVGTLYKNRMDSTAQQYRSGGATDRRWVELVARGVQTATVFGACRRPYSEPFLPDAWIPYGMEPSGSGSVQHERLGVIYRGARARTRLTPSVSLRVSPSRATSL